MKNLAGLGWLLWGALFVAILGGASATAWGEPPSRRQQEAEFRKLVARFEEERGKVPQDRMATIDAICDLRVPAGVAFLKKEALDPPKEDPIVKEIVLRGLGRAGTADGVRILLTVGFESLRVDQYGLIGDSLRKVTDPDAIDWLVKAGWRSIPTLVPAAQAEFLRVLHATGDARAALAAEKLLGNPQCPAASQVALIDLVRRHRHAQASAKVARLFRFDDPEVQVHVLYALRELQASDQSELFFEGVKSRHWQVRTVALDTLVRQNDPLLVPHFIAALSDPVQQVRTSALEGIRNLGGEDVMDPLIAAFKLHEGRTRDDIAEVLVHLTGEDLGAEPIAWESWWHSRRGKVPIGRISPADYEKAKAANEERATGLYYGLRIISKHVAFVIDVSGSMEQPYEVEVEEEAKKPDGQTGVAPRDRKRKRKTRQRIEVARDELCKAIDGIPLGTSFNLIKFSGIFGPWRPALISMTEELRAEAIQYARSLTPGGETNVFDTLMFALRLPEVDTIYFLSDGAPTAGSVTDAQEILAKVYEANNVKKVKIYTIGIHLDANAEALMRGLAESNYGRFVKK